MKFLSNRYIIITRSCESVKVQKKSLILVILVNMNCKLQNISKRFYPGKKSLFPFRDILKQEVKLEGKTCGKV